MADDTPELGRLVVLLHSLLSVVITGADLELDAGELAIAKEADALVMRIAHRSRSAAHYDKTERGKAALSDAAKVIEALELSQEKDPVFVEITDHVWSKEQIDGPILPGMKPERALKRRMYVSGMRLLTEAEIKESIEANADDS